jgi:tetratricopeptide (TPR) repeat protein
MELLSSLNGWVDSLFEQKKFDEALPVARRQLESYKTMFGEEHPGAAAIATNLASKYHEAQHPDAEEFYKQALAIKTKTLGYKHADVTSLSQKYASYLKAMGRNEEAEAVLESMVSSVSGVWKTVAAKMDKRGEKLTDGHLGKHSSDNN